MCCAHVPRFALALSDVSFPYLKKVPAWHAMPFLFMTVAHVPIKCYKYTLAFQILSALFHTIWALGIVYSQGRFVLYRLKLELHRTNTLYVVLASK